MFFIVNIFAALVTVLFTFLADYTEDEELAVGDVIKVGMVVQHRQVLWVNTQGAVG